jgi:hypothetical protein
MAQAMSANPTYRRREVSGPPSDLSPAWASARERLESRILVRDREGGDVRKALGSLLTQPIIELGACGGRRVRSLAQATMATGDADALDRTIAGHPLASYERAYFDSRPQPAGRMTLALDDFFGRIAARAT